jgi:hypothetical protein
VQNVVIGDECLINSCVVFTVVNLPSEVGSLNPVEDLLDDYLFINDAPLPPRVDLQTGQTRLLDPATFKGKGRSIHGGVATILSLSLHPERELVSVKIECDLYGVVLALIAARLVR